MTAVIGANAMTDETVETVAAAAGDPGLQAIEVEAEAEAEADVGIAMMARSIPTLRVAGTRSANVRTATLVAAAGETGVRQTGNGIAIGALADATLAETTTTGWTDGLAEICSRIAEEAAAETSTIGSMSATANGAHPPRRRSASPPQTLPTSPPSWSGSAA